MTGDGQPMGAECDVAAIVAWRYRRRVICILDKSSHCLELSVSAGRMVLYLHG